MVLIVGSSICLSLIMPTDFLLISVHLDSGQLLEWSSVCVYMLSHVQLFLTPWTMACQAPLSMEFSRQEYWSRLPFPSPGYLPKPGIKPVSLMSPALAGRFFTTGKPTLKQWTCYKGKKKVLWQSVKEDLLVMHWWMCGWLKRISLRKHHLWGILEVGTLRKKEQLVKLSVGKSWKHLRNLKSARGVH